MEDVFINKENLPISYRDKIRNEFVSLEELLSIIEDRESDYDILEEKYEELQEELSSNYKPISKEEEYGFSIRDFI